MSSKYWNYMAKRKLWLEWHPTAGQATKTRRKVWRNYLNRKNEVSKCASSLFQWETIGWGSLFWTKNHLLFYLFGMAIGESKVKSIDQPGDKDEKWWKYKLLSMDVNKISKARRPWYNSPKKSGRVKPRTMECSRAPLGKSTMASEPFRLCVNDFFFQNIFYIGYSMYDRDFPGTSQGHDAMFSACPRWAASAQRARWGCRNHGHLEL